MNKQLRTLRIVSVIVAASFLLAGCGIYTPLPDTPVNVTAKDVSNSFDQAQPVDLSLTQPVRINGILTEYEDTQVFSLGALQAGQTVSVNLKSKSIFQNSDVVVGLFDEDEEVAVLNETVVNTTTEGNTFLTVRKPGNYYLAISLFSAPGLGGFSYTMTATLGTATIPSPNRQIVYLNFNGASNVKIHEQNYPLLKPFSELPNGLGTAAIANKIAAQVQAYYSDWDIQILSSCEAEEPTEPHTVVYVCANGGNYYGLADQIDWYNQDLDDHAVVFTRLLALSNLTETQFILAVSNVAAHELGHLVGLMHTTDHTELMDQSTPLSLLTQNQDFHRAQLPQNEFPIGYEDSAELLQFSLGVLQP